MNHSSLLSVSVDLAIFTLQEKSLKVLLVPRNKAPFAGTAELPSSVLQQNETSLEAAKHILHNKAGASNAFLEQLYTFDEPTRNPSGRTISIAYYALVAIEKLHIQNDLGSEQAILMPISSLPELAFDHDTILSYATKRLRAKIEHTRVASSLMPSQFSLGQLQNAFETILDRKLDKRNFRKKYLSLGFIEPTGKFLEGSSYRPARLYRYITPID